jgi:sialic acid synthase SpsE
MSEKFKYKTYDPKGFNFWVRAVGAGSAPLVIAEMSGNHNQSLERALEIVDAAAHSGAHALKIQTYTAETMTIDIREREFFISDEKSLWKGESLFDLYKKAYTPWEWHEAIFDRAKEHKMLAFSTPFDRTDVDFLENLNVPCYKIASFENTDLSLIRYVAATGKPMIISTGMATFAELDESVEAARAAGCKDLVLLKCTSTYPSTPDDSNILTIPEMRSDTDVKLEYLITRWGLVCRWRLLLLVQLWSRSTLRFNAQTGVSIAHFQWSHKKWLNSLSRLSVHGRQWAKCNMARRKKRKRH